MAVAVVGLAGGRRRRSRRVAGGRVGGRRGRFALYAEVAGSTTIWVRVAGTWSESIAVPGPLRQDPGVVGTDAELILWGGYTDGRPVGDGLAYSLATGTWRTIAPGPLSPRRAPVLVWTGTRVVVASGSADPGTLDPEVGAYVPNEDRWEVTPPVEGSPQRRRSSAPHGTVPSAVDV